MTGPRSSRTPAVGGLAALVLSSLLGVRVGAQDYAAPEAGGLRADVPRFLVESIAVEGTRSDSLRRIVVSQSRLEAGREYAERDLDEAVRRVKRLPFLLDARPALRRGSMRGAYEFVLHVEENARVYTALEAQFVDRMSQAWATGQLGFEHFLGPDGLLLGSILGWRDPAVPDRQRAALGFQKFDVFGPATLLAFDLAVSTSGPWEDFRGGARVVLPTGGDHSLQASVDVFTLSIRPGREGRRVRLSPAVNWIYDTTDEPFAPRVGRRLHVNLQYTRPLDAGVELPDRDPRYSRAAIDVAMFQPLLGPLGLSPSLVAACPLFDSSEECYATGALALRLVGARGGNRERAYTEVRVWGSTGDGRPEGRWGGDVAVGFRSKWTVLVLDFSWSS